MIHWLHAKGISLRFWLLKKMLRLWKWSCVWEKVLRGTELEQVSQRPIMVLISRIKGLKKILKEGYNQLSAIEKTYCNPTEELSSGHMSMRTSTSFGQIHFFKKAMKYSFFRERLLASAFLYRLFYLQHLFSQGPFFARAF